MTGNLLASQNCLSWCVIWSSISFHPSKRGILFLSLLPLALLKPGEQLCSMAEGTKLIYNQVPEGDSGSTHPSSWGWHPSLWQIMSLLQIRFAFSFPNGMIVWIWGDKVSTRCHGFISFRPPKVSRGICRVKVSVWESWKLLLSCC